MMKNCLITGGGSKFGSKLTDQLINVGYRVYLITSSQNYIDHPSVVTINVDWKTLGLGDLRRIISDLPTLDLVFFNHNSSALGIEKFSKNHLQSIKDWQQSYFVACQFPFYLIHSLRDKISTTTKVGWMLSNLIKNPGQKRVGNADYIGNKFTNGCMMKAFAQSFPAVFFGINPEIISGDSNEDVSKAQGIVHVIETYQNLNGKIYYPNGNQFDF